MNFSHIQMIDQKGNYNVHAVEKFMTVTNLSNCGRSYSVVAVLGPQSGGKSTLMNCLFGTHFRQMNPLGESKQTTQGIWIAKGVGNDGRFIIAMDIEGADGSERGEDDTAFEKQSALFALATADVVIINMWCHDIGKEHAACKPLLKVVFQVMVRMSSGSGCPKKVTLMFVLRDKTKNTFENLKNGVMKSITKIWDTVAERNPNVKHDLSKYFHIKVVALSSYERDEERFKQEVGEMKQTYFGSNLSQRNGDRHDQLPASEFAYSTEQMWRAIKANKDLDFPAHRVMVETFRCETIANEKFSLLSSDKEWLKLKFAAEKGPVSGYKQSFLSILKSTVKLYDQETMYYDKVIKDAKRQELHSKSIRELAYPTFIHLVHNFHSNVLEQSESMFEDFIAKGRKGFKPILEFGAKLICEHPNFSKAIIMPVTAPHDCVAPFFGGKKAFDALKARSEEFLKKRLDEKEEIFRTCTNYFDHACEDAKIEQTEWDTTAAREKLLRDLNKQFELLSSRPKNIWEDYTAIAASVFDSLAAAIPAIANLVALGVGVNST